VTVEAQLTGSKGYYDCPVKLFFYGASDPRERTRIEQGLKNDKLVKATEMKRLKKESENQRTIMGLKAGGSTYGMGLAGTNEPEIQLEDILKKSESIEFRNGTDAIKTFALDEQYLSRMPTCEQPAALKTNLLPYQLQVCL
jgi:SWI/SNF-related matrix-associated actin-dependent regulator of chromatin subfamily A3